MSSRLYKRVKKLGDGGMGEVWLVMDPDTRVLYAQKIMKAHLSREKDIERFKREITALQRLRHDNIIHVHEVIETGGQPGYVMEYCPDGNLLDYLSKHPDIPLLPIIIQLSRAVVSGDLKVG